MKAFFKRFTQAFLIGVMVYIIIVAIQYFYNGWRPNGYAEVLQEFWFNQLYAVSLYASNALLFDYLTNKYKKKLFTFKNILIAIFGGIAVTLITIWGIRLFFSLVIYHKSFVVAITQDHLGNYIVGFSVSAVVTTLFYLVNWYKHKQETRVKEQKIIAGAASAKFDALKNQLDPHFLFNSLNVLTSLIEENPEAATNFTTALSKVYRYVLEQKNKDLVTVAEELKFARLYMSLIEMRFEESIVFTIQNPIQNPDGKVVPLSLQLLLENAVKHNQVTPNKKLHITIQEEKGTLVVTNNIQTKQVVKESSGVGLKNIIQRYSLLTKKEVVIHNDNKHFVIAVPILDRQATIINTQEDYIADKRYAKAQEYVEKLKGFYAHLIIYCLFIPVFIYLNYISGSGFPWAIFPIGGWGMGVMGHASETFNWNPFFGKNWEQRKIQELIDKDDE